MKADRATLRAAVAEVLRPHASLGGTPPRYELPFFDGATPSLPRISGWRPLDDVADAVLAALPEQESVCICGHPERQHFEDVCIIEITGCDCGDFLPVEEAAEEVVRLRRIVRQTAELRRVAAEEQPAETHSCRNCEGIDPDTCLFNPDRPKQPPMDPVHILGIDACPTPLTHNWGCGCPTDQAPAVGEQPDTQTREARS